MMRARLLAVTVPALLASLLVASCANPPPARNLSYVALLKSPDGSVGKVIVTGPKGQQIIAQERLGALLDGSQAPAAVDEAQFQRDFGAAVAAQPQLPEHYVLYFESGGAQLTAESQAQLQTIVEQATRRATLDMSVIGHSDTVGKPETNEALSLKRAQVVAELLRTKGLRADNVAVESHGERNLLVPTPDETPEPRNRRVEVVIR